MKHGRLIIKMPSTCARCPLERKNLSGEFICLISKDPTSQDKRQSNCPLIEGDVCEWENNDDAYETSCKETVILEPESELFEYCPYCGNKIEYVQEQK